MIRPIFLLFLALLIWAPRAQAFCGFYVAKADATLYNHYSQVILVRDGDRTVITMSNDFKGEVKDFALVVPVPTILKKDQIRVVDRGIFDRFDAYTTPRLVEYYDEPPCWDKNVMEEKSADMDMPTTTNSPGFRKMPQRESVKVEASYTIGEYDIVLLSAEESGGLETWLHQNGYKIPTGAKEVLDPYVKGGMKFFVVKVNLGEQSKTGFNYLRPIQISFNHPKFMLPIRLGMANSTDDQDLVVYSFTRNGRVESTNYRNALMPTDMDIPEFIQPKFGPFYASTFTKAWKREGRNSVMLEYAWDLSGSNYVKCDPCPTQPPYYSDLKEAGVDWLTINNDPWSGGGYAGPCFVTRMHVRYNRQTFPQDLQFQETPNKSNFQCRYVIHHPALHSGDCPEYADYLRDLINRRTKELTKLQQLTGWDISQNWNYVSEISQLLGTGSSLPPSDSLTNHRSAATSPSDSTPTLYGTQDRFGGGGTDTDANAGLDIAESDKGTGSQFWKMTTILLGMICAGLVLTKVGKALQKKP